MADKGTFGTMGAADSPVKSISPGNVGMLRTTLAKEINYLVSLPPTTFSEDEYTV